MIIPNWVLLPLKMLNDAGYECFVVGGAVRSWLMDAEIHDYDLATSALPEEMKQVFSGMRTLDTGIKHGTLTVLVRGRPVEITTYRTEGTYTDHRHPDKVTFTKNLREDCARRDFTVNAMAYHPITGILDFYGGQDDIGNRIIRCIGAPEERFSEDALRILRALRFSSQLSFAIEEKTSAAIHAMKDSLVYVSAERIREELLKLLEGKDAAPVFAAYPDVFSVFLNGLEDTDRTASMIAASMPDALVRTALIIRTMDGDPKDILKQLKFPSADITVISNLISLEDRPVKTRTDIRYILRDLKTGFDRYLDYRAALDRSVDKTAAVSVYRGIVYDGDCFSLRELAVNGNDLMEYGLKGKAVGDTLNEILEAVIEDRIKNTAEDIRLYLKDHIVL